MSSHTALFILFIFIIPAGVLLVLRRLRMRRRARADQADLEAIFASHKNDSGQGFF